MEERNSSPSRVETSGVFFHSCLSEFLPHAHPAVSHITSTPQTECEHTFTFGECVCVCKCVPVCVCMWPCQHRLYTSGLCASGSQRHRLCSLCVGRERTRFLQPSSSNLSIAFPEAFVAWYHCKAKTCATHNSDIGGSGRAQARIKDTLKAAASVFSRVSESKNELQADSTRSKTQAIITRIGCLASRDPSPAVFTTRSAAPWRFRDGANPWTLCHQLWRVLHVRSNVAHTDPSSVVVDCDICHAHFCE